MLRELVRRGPDEEGVFEDAGARLGIRRLRIIDLETGSQPISTPERDLTIVFNGEIYNFRDLRRELEARGHLFRTQSDTETVLLGFREWGNEVFDRLDGMFAVALWDTRRRRLTLARDRIGEKPLYWNERGGRLAFASEIRAIRHALRSVPRTSRPALARYLFYGYSPSPETLIEEVEKLCPAEVLTFDSGGVRRERYWRPPTPPSPDRGAASGALDRDLLAEAVRSRLISDVPLGAFLSGGIDSTVIVREMTRARAAPQTFCIGFEDTSYDESAKARAVAEILETHHTSRLFAEEELVNTVSSLTQIVDEPLADASILPTHLLSRVARAKVTVCLSGDGGDELFGGYPTYPAHLWADALGTGAAVAGKSLASLAHGLAASDSNLSLDFKLAKFSLGLGEEPAWRHSLWMSYCAPAQIGCLLPDLAGTALRDLIEEPVRTRLEGRTFATNLDLAMYLDLTMYLAEGVLMKVDRASMACSLEVRAPFLARAVIEKALTTPARLKVDWRHTKKGLRLLLDGSFPPKIVRQPKKGFGIPIARWLRTIAREDALRTLRRLDVDQGAAVRLWEEHDTRKRNHRMALWALYVFGKWQESLTAPAAG